jgi:hypothetical protein
MKIRFITIGIILLILVPTTTIQAQDDQKMSFGVLGGVNFQNLNGKDIEGNKLENDLILGFHGGVKAEIPVAPEFYFQPGLLFSTKGAKHTNALMTNTYKLSYLEVPLNFVYKGLLGNGYFMLGLGPYVGAAIGGKVITEAASATLERDIEFKNVVELSDPLTTPYFKRMDVGGNLFFGYELASHLFFQINTQLGMMGINPEYKALPEDKSIIKNTGFGLSVGYNFSAN